MGHYRWWRGKADYLKNKLLSLEKEYLRVKKLGMGASSTEIVKTSTMPRFLLPAFFERQCYPQIFTGFTAVGHPRCLPGPQGVIYSPGSLYTANISHWTVFSKWEWYNDNTRLVNSSTLFWMFAKKNNGHSYIIIKVNSLGWAGRKAQACGHHAPKLSMTS